ncbi:MAG: membrane fusion protein (multidrug efflux system) [Oceanicoccus sp.]
MRKYFFNAFVVCLVLALTACGSDSSDARIDVKNKRPATSVMIWIAKQVLVSDRVESVGTLKGVESVTITAKVTDQVMGIHFEDGQYVKTGDVLIELTNAAQRAELREAQANLGESELQLERLKKLGKKIVTAPELDEALAKVKTGRARLEVIAVRLSDRVILAPFDGLLGFRRVSEGALVTPGTIITELDDIRQLKLDFAIPEMHLAKVGVGAAVSSTTPAWPGKTFSGELVSIGSRIDIATRTFTARALIDNASSHLRPGMLLNVTLAMAERKVLVVPEQAVVQNGKRTIVYIVEGVDEQLKANAITVELGKRVSGGVEIVSGLELGTKVVVNGQINLRPGAAVKIVNPLNAANR